ncbi:MAG: hypothetical protein ACKOE6_14845, partial [Flammeovirgaceae bacterium]
MTTVSIDINLVAQEARTRQKTFLVLGILTALWFIVYLIWPDFRPSPYFWLPMLPSFVDAILYGLGRKRIMADNFPYLRIDHQKIESFGGGFFAKPKTVYWSQSNKVDIKLFEINVSTLDKTE